MTREEEWQAEGGAIMDKYRTESRAALGEAARRELARRGGDEATNVALQNTYASQRADNRLRADIAEAKNQKAFYNRENMQDFKMKMEAQRHQHRMELIERKAELNDPKWYEDLGQIMGSLGAIIGTTNMFDQGGVPEVSQPDIPASSFAPIEPVGGGQTEYNLGNLPR